MIKKYKLLSIIYGMIIIVLGVILPIVETAMNSVVPFKQDSDDVNIIFLNVKIVLMKNKNYFK